jgi:hypothetical protein
MLAGICAGARRLRQRQDQQKPCCANKYYHENSRSDS